MLKVNNHIFRDDKYIVKDDKGVICGGNAMIYILNEEMSELTYPTVFGTRREAETFIALKGTK